jgi:DNA replication protein DnaC
MNALARARQYVEEFDGNIASFIFSGKPGTGKNHLAAPLQRAAAAREVGLDHHRRRYYVGDERRSAIGKRAKNSSLTI